MLSRGDKARGKAGAVLAACAVAALLAATGCGSSGGSGGSGGGQPSWAKSIGTGVTVVPPGQSSPGHDSPGAVMAGVYSAITKGPATDFCKYEQPSAQATCNSAFSQQTQQQIVGELPTFKNFGMGYVVIDGARALIGITGTVCVPHQTPKCFSNTDPAAIFKSGKPFATLWTQAVSAPANVYSLSPAVKVNGKWYAYTSSGA
jgi:hypothetical protein